MQETFSGISYVQQVPEEVIEFPQYNGEGTSS